MSNFKIKKKKKEKLEYRDSTTLDKKHKEQSSIFIEQKKSLPEKQELIDKLKKDLEVINTNKVVFTEIELEQKATNDDDHQLKFENIQSDIVKSKDDNYSESQTEIDNLRKEINKIKNELRDL